MSSSPAPIDAATLFKRHAPFVATFASRLGVPPADIDDIVQETFMVAHRRGGFVAGAAKPTTWLAAVTLRVWSTLKRTRRRKPEVACDESLQPSQEPWSTLEARQGLRRVELALAHLSEESRTVFVLFELQGESCEEIGQGLEIPLGTVYSRLHHARRKFLEIYGTMNPLEHLPTHHLANTLATLDQP